MKLPNELCFAIFLSVHTFTERERPRNSLKTLMLLNRRSHEIVMKSASLWTVVTVKMWKSSTTSERTASLRAHLEMGGRRPLDVIIVGNTCQKETQDLLFGLTDPEDAKRPGNGLRIRSLTFPSSEKNQPGKVISNEYFFPNLEVVHLSRINHGVWSAPDLISPNLRVLIQPSGRVTYGRDGDIEVPSLRVLDLRHSSAFTGRLGGSIEFRQLLRLSSTLEELSFAPRVKGHKYVRCLASSSGLEPTIPGPYRMPNIKLLRLGGLSPEALQFLTGVDMPALQHLCIVEIQEHQYSSIKFTRSFEALRILDWSQRRNASLQGALKPFLAVAPNLEEVIFRSLPHDDNCQAPREGQVPDEELQLLLIRRDDGGLAFAPMLRVVRVEEASIQAIRELITLRPALKIFVNRLQVEELNSMELMSEIGGQVEITPD